LKPEELANFDAFLKNPQLVWEWYNHRKQIVHQSQPNPAHISIAEMQNILPEVSVITQNIDNLHKRAGSRTVYELHGNIERNYCIKCGKKYEEIPEVKDGAPLCDCGGLIRPDVVWFGEYLPEDQFSGAAEAAENSDVFIIVGTSGVVYPAASLIFAAKSNGAYLLEINIEPTEVSSSVDESIFGKAGEVLPEVLRMVKEKLSMKL
jgi:NAD-dependent deacetylase